jgi:AmmeMemoRadiSam system protein A
MPSDAEHYLTPDEEELLLKIARDALTARLHEGRSLDLSAYVLTPTLKEKHGAFVTLRHGEELRGCIGYTASLAPLAETVRDNAVNAATRDPRFRPVAPEEVDALTIEISALTPGDLEGTPFKAVSRPSEIVIGRDGLYIERPPDRGGLLLPQVAVEQHWDVEAFLKGVCMKAGYPPGVWKLPEFRLYRFSAQVFSEKPSAPPAPPSSIKA